MAYGLGGSCQGRCGRGANNKLILPDIDIISIMIDCHCSFRLLRRRSRRVHSCKAGAAELDVEQRR